MMFIIYAIYSIPVKGQIKNDLNIDISSEHFYS